MAGAVSSVSVGPPVADPEDQLRLTVDRAEVVGLLERYQLALDDGTFDELLIRATFRPDVVLDFPPGRHQGTAGLLDFTRNFMRHWARTHHHASGYVVGVDGDRASAGWNLIATHVHHDSPPPPAPGHLFQLGGRFEADLVRTPHGWRVRSLHLRVIWTAGDGVPSIAAVMASEST